MIEINRKPYLKDRRNQRPAGYVEIKKVFQVYVRHLRRWM